MEELNWLGWAAGSCVVVTLVLLVAGVALSVALFVGFYFFFSWGVKQWRKGVVDVLREGRKDPR